MTIGTSKAVFTFSNTFNPSSIPGPRNEATLVRLALSKLDLNTYSIPRLLRIDQSDASAGLLEALTRQLQT